MSALRQSRANRDRRRVSRNLPPIVPDIAWRITAIAGNNVTLTLGAVTGLLTLLGIPQLINTQTGAGPQGAILVYPTLTLNYANPQSGIDNYTLAAQDAGLRTSVGSYLADGTDSFQISFPPTIGVLHGSSTVVERIGVCDADTASVYLPDPTGLPDGEWYCICNSDPDGGVLTVEDAIGNVLGTLNGGIPGAQSNQMGLCICNAGTWSMAAI
jgi:hypothetical protein